MILLTAMKPVACYFILDNDVVLMVMYDLIFWIVICLTIYIAFMKLLATKGYIHIRIQYA